MTYYEQIEKILNDNKGILHTQDLTKNNIPRQYLKELQKKGIIKKVSRGLYISKDGKVNEFYILQNNYKNAIFSHNTALYFYDLTDRTPIKLDLTFKSNVRIENDMVNSHYIKEDNYELGLTTKTLEDGTKIRIYNLERTICDIIRDRNKMDSQIVNHAIREYVKRKDINLVLLNRYARKFKIKNIIKKYLEVLM